MNRNEGNFFRRIPEEEAQNIIDQLFKLIVFLLVTLTLLKLSTIGTPYEVTVHSNETTASNNTGVNATAADGVETAQDENKSSGEKVDVVKKAIVRQPACPKSYLLVILEDICKELFVKNFYCALGDYYKEMKREARKKQQRKEAKVPAIINYAVGGLLISSVGAALLELYKAKKQDKKKDNKSPLSRKCSLADLTVLKHHRKELIRRESIMEVPEDRENTKQLGFAPPPLLRRCSFPVGPNAASVNSFGIIADNITTETSRRISVIEEGTTFIDDRKHSIVLVDDSRRTSVIDSRHQSAIDIRRISLDDSPERRHHRLVHRH